MSSPGFGLITEDPIDADVVRVVIRRLRGEGEPIRSRGDGGCGQILRRARAWMRDLVAAGCPNIIIMHDLDLDPCTGARRDERALRAKLEAIEPPPGINRLICIPVEEIEAWFWSDQGVLDHLAQGHAKASTTPNTIVRPKEKLRAASTRANHRPKFNTNMNADYARMLNFEVCRRYCPSFAALCTFIGSAPANSLR